MRTEKEMFDLITNIAKDDNRIRAAILNGSRTNPNAPKDIFQDFDIIYFVKDVDPFRNNYNWIKQFGEIMIMQMPEDMVEPPGRYDGRFIYLMQFKDGNRIDLTLLPLSNMDKFENDSLTKVLLDKDGIFANIENPSDSDYLILPPNAKLFADCCNEFWWITTYVAKGIWRNQILYSKHVYNHYLTEQLMKMLMWYAGIKTMFKANAGTHGKFLKKYIEKDLWDRLLQTFSDGNYENVWNSLFVSCELFHETALNVAHHFDFKYNQAEEENVLAHLRYVKTLPKNAKDMYPMSS